VHKELELWRFVAERLRRGESTMLLVVAESAGSSPGRPGYKMAVGADGELAGSIGGGVMEVSLVEQSRAFLRDAETRGRGDAEISSLTEQVHRKDVANASGMICSGKQTVVFKLLTPSDTTTVDSITDALAERRPDILTISPNVFSVRPPEGGTQNLGSTTPPAKAGTPPIQQGSLGPPPEGGTQNIDFTFEKRTGTDFVFAERLGFKNDLYIIGGGHCALALSELMSKMDFHISLLDDRPELNTIAKNRFAHKITIIDGYENVGDHVRSGENCYVVVMTLGYKSDDIVIRRLIDHDFKYFGVLGSNAKMSSMFRELIKEGLPAEKLDRIHTPVGLAINSRTPEEIAVSIAAEMISVKNSA
jgi:xanthine dehydrogenase accessory factor